MPYVQVWVDEPLCDCPDCTGDCDRGRVADVLEARIDTALVAIVQGRQYEVEAILRGYVDLQPRASVDELQSAMREFKAGRLPGFVSLAGGGNG